MDVEGEVALTLQNMKEHFIAHGRVPSDSFPSSHFDSCVKILTQEGESKLHFTLMYQTLCPSELLIFIEGGLCWTQYYPQVFLYTSSVVVPVKPIFGWQRIAGSKPFPVRTVVLLRAKKDS